MTIFLWIIGGVIYYLIIGGFVGAIMDMWEWDTPELGVLVWPLIVCLWILMGLSWLGFEIATRLIAFSKRISKREGN